MFAFWNNALVCRYLRHVPPIRLTCSRRHMMAVKTSFSTRVHSTWTMHGNCYRPPSPPPPPPTRGYGETNQEKAEAIMKVLVWYSRHPCTLPPTVPFLRPLRRDPVASTEILPCRFTAAGVGVSSSPPQGRVLLQSAGGVGGVVGIFPWRGRVVVFFPR